MQDTAIHCTALQRAATRCSTLQPSAQHCNTLLVHSSCQRHEKQQKRRPVWGLVCVSYELWVTNCDSWTIYPLYRALHANVTKQCAFRIAFRIVFVALQHTTAHGSTRQHTAAHGSTLQHTATRWNTLQRDNLFFRIASRMCPCQIWYL